MRFKNLSLATALVACLSFPAVAATTDQFSVRTELVGVSLGRLANVNVSTNQTGVRNSPATPDVSLAQTAANVNLGLTSVNLNLGVIGLEWLTDNTFEVFTDLNSSVRVGPLNIPVAANVQPTFNTRISNLDFDFDVYDVRQISGDFQASDISFTQDTIDIDFNNLVGAGVSLFGEQQRATFEVVQQDVTAPIPLPAAGWLLFGGIAGMGYFSRRKNKS